MSQFLTSISPFFNRVIRERGAQYAAQRCVTIDSHDDRHLESTVTGTKEYDVSIDRKGRRLVCGCTCPYFTEGDLCKHIWASLCIADSISSPLLRHKGLTVIPDYELMDDSEYDDDDEFDGDDEYPQKASSPEKPLRKPPPPLAYGSSFLQSGARSQHQPPVKNVNTWHGLFPDFPAGPAKTTVEPEARLTYYVDLSRSK